MEVKMLYPQIIGYSLILAFIMLLFWRRRKKYKKGVIVANSRYVKRQGYYKFLAAKYHIINALIKLLCILLVLTSAIMTARLYKSDKNEETKENRDIMLCMDVSGSVYDLDEEIVGTFVDIVSSLKDERFGISAFNSSPVTILPLTTDYNYAINLLEIMKSVFATRQTTPIATNGQNTSSKTIRNLQLINQLFVGTDYGNGTSLIGDGLAYSCSTFKKDDGRTKIVIFTTDNELAGSPLIELSAAAGYCKNNDVKVYPIGTKSITANHRNGLIEVANVTGGKYYDYKNFSTDEIVEDIHKLNATSIISNVYVTNQDLPEKILPYILIILPLLYLLSWRVRI